MKCWERVYYLLRDGSNLTTLMGAANSVPDCPAVLVIEDTFGHKFGAFMEMGLQAHTAGYNSVWTMRGGKGLKVWQDNSSGGTLCALRSDGLGIGSGSYAIFLNGDMSSCTTSLSTSFSNKPLTPFSPFSCHNVELWVLKGVSFI